MSDSEAPTPAPGSIVRFPDSFLPARMELLDSLPFRFLSMERASVQSRDGRNDLSLWDGFLLAHPLTKGKVGDSAVPLYHFLRASSIFDWQVLLHCPTTMDVNKGTLVAQLSQSSLKNLLLKIDGKKPRDPKVEGRTPILQAYARLSRTLMANARWHS